MSGDDIEHENFKKFPILTSSRCFNEHDFQFEETEVQIIEFEHAKNKIDNSYYLRIFLAEASVDDNDHCKRDLNIESRFY